MVTIYLSIDDDYYVTGWGSTRSSEDDVRMEVPESHEVIRNPEVYRIEDGVLTRCSEKEEELIESAKPVPSDVEVLREENEMLAMAILELSSEILSMKGGD